MLGPRASPSSLLVQPSSSLLLSPSLSSDLADLSPPLSRESLGQATWAFLHTLAALYPTSPTAEEKDAALALLGALRLLYPCPKCREHWTEMWERRPAEVGSREELQRWMCDAHNEINVRLDKAVSVGKADHTGRGRGDQDVERGCCTDVVCAVCVLLCSVDCDRVGEKWPSELRECGCGPEDNATSTAT